MFAFWLFAFASLGFWKFTGAAGTDALTRVGAWEAWLAAALVLATAAFRKDVVRRGPAGRDLLLAALLAAAAAAAPFPWRVPPAVLAAGFAALAASALPPFGLLARGLLGAGAFLTLQALVVALLPTLLARRHEVPGAAWALALPLRLMGMDAQSAPNGVSVNEPGGSLLYSVRLENLLAPSFAVLAATGLAGLRRFGRGGVKAHLAWLLGLAAYAFARLVVVVAAHAATEDRDLFLDPWLHLLSLAPLLVFLCWRERGRGAEARRAEGDTGAGRERAGVPLAAAAAGLGLLALVWNAPDPGTPQLGRILIDEFHSDWESAQEPLDTTHYGMRTVYTYKTMTDFLRLHYPSVEVNREALTAARLAAFDVLILKTPTRAYDEDEARAVLDFVARGGGLWLIGDHTNVFGMGTYLNRIAEPLGMRFLPDATADLGHGGRQLYAPPAWFAHPIVAHMETMLFATSDSLAAAGPVEAALLGKDLYLDDPDFSVLNFFGDFRLRPHKPYGVFIQCGVRAYGRGRVAAFTDSTLFSNFSFFFPGIYQLALGTTQWLNRRPIGWGLGFAVAVVGVGLFGWGARRLRASGTAPGAAVRLAAAFWLGVAAAAQAHAAIVRACYAPPPPRAPLVRVAFPTEGVGYRLPLDHETHGWDADNYHTFFVATQRIGLVPRVVGRLADALEAEAVVLADRLAPFSDDDLGRLRRYVEGGGRLLVMDYPGGGPPPAPDDPTRYHPNRPTPAGLLLAHLGMSFGDPQGEQTFRPAQPDAAFAGMALAHPMAVYGGTPALVSEQGVPVLAVKSIGRGTVVAFGGSRAFAVGQMGQPGDVPARQQIDLYRLEYWMFTRLLGIGTR